MAFPSTIGTVPDNLSFVWERVRGIATEIKQFTQDMRTHAVNGTDAKTILDYCGTLAQEKDQMNAIAGTPGLAVYAQQQIDDATFDVVASYQTMMTQLDAVINWIVTNFPKDANGYLLRQTIDSNGRTSERYFSASDLTTYVTVLDGLLATIN